MSEQNGTPREDALACLLASIHAVDPAALVTEYLIRNPPPEARIHLASIGKAAGTMAAGAHAVLGDRICDGVVIVPHGVEAPVIPGVRTYRGGHPIPNEEGVEGARAILDLAHSLSGDDVLLFLISGGGSALMTLPPAGISLDEVRDTTDLLLRAGATIGELNCVRKHLDQAKGGRLARAAAPARVIGLVLSDVSGDPLDVIASGPLSPDPTTFETATKVLTARDLWDLVPAPVRSHLIAGLAGDEEESPAEGAPAFDTVDVHVIGSNSIAALAAREEAERRGYRTTLLTTTLSGEAREVGRVLAAIGREVLRSGEPLKAPACIVAAGETTVTVRGSGKGGRNQELALSAALEIRGNDRIVIGSVGTDGIDGPTEAAGAIVDGATAARGWREGLDPLDSLARNDANPFLAATGDLVITGPTGTNVMDIQLVLVTAERTPGQVPG